MRTISLLLAAVVGLAVGVACTWLILHRSPAAAPSATTGAPASADQQVLYWYDPMVPAQHFDKPGKSPYMDMQLVPKIAGQAGDSSGAGVVQIDPRQVQNLGLRTAHAERGALTRTVRVTGTVAFDERAVMVVQARTSGIVERLEVRAPLTAVKQGQALLTLIAPDWTAAQEEYLSLRRARSTGLDELRDAARRRLLLLGMSEGQIRVVERSGQAQTRITITAPRDGVIGELSVREGAAVTVGAPLLRINGLDTVWINAAIPEARVGRVTAASSVAAELPAFPGEHFVAHIDALLPDIDAATRTQTARLLLPNPGHRIAPGMFAQIEFTASKEQPTSVLVPTDAVIATGARSVVIVVDGEGRFRAQEIHVGDESDGNTEVLEGLEDGDAIVLSGQFLIDSEASLSGTLARLGGKDKAPKAMAPDKAMVMPDEAAPPPMYRAEGTLERIDGNRWTIAADAIPSLQMGAMTMTFVRPAVAAPLDIRAGQRVTFSFVRNADSVFEIAKIAAIAGKSEALQPKPASGGTP
jgi:Cu(I)/Ag(I) efflux system membrane fusion protein